MISMEDYRTCGIAINLLKILNKEAREIIMFNTSMVDVATLVKGVCNVRVGCTVSQSSRDGEIHIAGITKHHVSEAHTKKFLEEVVNRLGDSYWKQVKEYKNIFGG